MTILESNDAEMYRLLEDDAGHLVLEVMLGGIALYEMKVPLTPDEAARYRDEGPTFLRWLLDRVRDAPADYSR